MLQWFLPYIDRNQPWIYMCSPSQSPSPTSLPIPPLWVFPVHQPEHLSHASNLGWGSVSPLIVYLFHCCSLRTSHCHLLPESPKVCSVHLCLFFCFAYRVSVTIFLNSIYIACNFQMTRAKCNCCPSEYVGENRDFPGGPVAETPCSQCRGPEFHPWSGNQIPHAAT